MTLLAMEAMKYTENTFSSTKYLPPSTSTSTTPKEREPWKIFSMPIIFIAVRMRLVFILTEMINLMEKMC